MDVGAVTHLHIWTDSTREEDSLLIDSVTVTDLNRFTKYLYYILYNIIRSGSGYIILYNIYYIIIRIWKGNSNSITISPSINVRHQPLTHAKKSIFQRMVFDVWFVAYMRQVPCHLWGVVFYDELWTMNYELCATFIMKHHTPYTMCYVRGQDSSVGKSLDPQSTDCRFEPHCWQSVFLVWAFGKRLTPNC